MKCSRTLGLMLALLTVSLLVTACGSKKKKDQPAAAPTTPSAEQVFKLNACPVARIEIDPPKSENDGVTIGSMAEVKLTATAYDANGQAVNVPLTWKFRHPDLTGPTVAGGHKLEVVDNNHATFRAAGIAQGEFIIIAEDQSCNLTSDKDHPQYVEGMTWVRVNNKPGLEVTCGRMRATYGDEIDRISQKTIASSKITLLAEVYGPAATRFKYMVRFYYNNKTVPELQPLRHAADYEMDDPKMVHWKAFVPLYLTPGEYAVRYELLRVKGFKTEVVCGSATERFTAR